MPAISAIFVVGTGRSGTHFTCHCLREFDKLDDFLGGREHRATLDRVTLAAMSHKGLPNLALFHYAVYAQRARLGGKILVDQHHPNLFHIDRLAALFPGAVFVYPERPAVQVIASMLTHKGVGGWYAKLRDGSLKVPWPNRFFGLDSYEQLLGEPLHKLCLRRIFAHRMAVVDARNRYGARVRFLSYPALVRDRIAELQRVFTSDEVAQFGRCAPATKSDSSSLRKYESVLTAHQIDDIEATEAQFSFA